MNNTPASDSPDGQKESKPLCAMSDIKFRPYCGESDIKYMSELCVQELSEPYNKWVYRFFIARNPDLNVLAFNGEECIGIVMSKIDKGTGCGDELSDLDHGYIGMVAVRPEYRRYGIATKLALKVINRFIQLNIPYVDLEVEVCNKSAISFYSRLGFVIVSELPRNYVVGSTAYKMRLYLSAATNPKAKQKGE